MSWLPERPEHLLTAFGQEADEAQGQIANKPTTFEYPGSAELPSYCYSTPTHVRTSWLETLNLPPLYRFFVTQFPQVCYFSHQSQGYQVYFVIASQTPLLLASRHVLHTYSIQPQLHTHFG